MKIEIHEYAQYEMIDNMCKYAVIVDTITASVY